MPNRASFIKYFLQFVIFANLSIPFNGYFRKRRRSSYNEDEDGEDEIVFNYRAAIKRPQTEEPTSQEVDPAPRSGH